ncbi:MAG: putative peptidase, partial [Shewanella sp.]
MSELKVTEVMSVALTKDAPAAHWGKADVTYTAEGALVHLSGGDELRQIQMAARKLRNQGISNVALSGSLWDVNSQWVFAQGFATAKPG